jgi:PAS domain S-box-containing protein
MSLDLRSERQRTVAEGNGSTGIPALHVAISQDKIFDLLPLGVCICDAPNGTIRYYNDHAARLWGQRPVPGGSEAQFPGALKLYLPNGSWLPHDRSPMAEALHKGIPICDRELILERPDESRIVVLINVSPLQDEAGKTVAVVSFFRDITAQKHLEAELREYEQELKHAAEVQNRLAAIVESSDDAIISKDLNGIITSWNKGAERIFGYTAAEVIGKPVSMLAVPGRRNEMPAILSQIQRGKHVKHYETIRQRKDGQPIYVSLTVSPVKDSEGRIIGASKIARDITERKRAEEERALHLSREQEARKTAELLNRIGPILAVELDPGKVVESVTKVATELVGAEFGQFAATAPGEGIVRCDDITDEARNAGQVPQFETIEGHLPIRSYLAAPVKSRSGEVLGGLFFGHSAPEKFTEQHEAILAGIAAQAAIAVDNARLFEQAQWAQNELKRSNEELRHANQDLETFVYSASHDLKEPLRTMAISAQLLERKCGAELQGEAVQFLSSIVQGARRMENLICDLLAYATATRYAEGPPAALDSGKVLAGVIESLKGQIQQAGATVSFGELPVISMHESRLALIFQNLISNALKYRRQEVPCVHISAVERDGWSVFSVVDNGIGIEPRFAEQIFGLFKRLHSREKYPGTGMGLAICQRIVEQYGGRIWLEKSIPGEGSTFCFTIPACAR